MERSPNSPLERVDDDWGPGGGPHLSGRTLGGLILVILGLGLFALQSVAGFGEALVFFLVGAIFVAAYLVRGRYGFLIPGCILLGIGLGRVGTAYGYDFGALEGLGLGGGFLAIYLIDRIYRGRSHWWPLIPGTILLIGPLLTRLPEAQRVVEIAWPLGLILVGLILLVGAQGITRRL
ncbi:MAG: hypothetical protein FJ033_10225 [Chloroflexi bacterium]|nr:hypothetical protein [Chloroflexota bacterium]